MDVGSIDQRQFLAESLGLVNQHRQQTGVAELEPDTELQEWLGKRTLRVARGGQDAADQLLTDLQEVAPGVNAAAVNLLYGTDSEELSSLLSSWRECAQESEFTHFTTTLFHDESKRSLACLALATQQLPRFTPALLNEGRDTFYNVCEICEKPHAGRVGRSSRAIVLKCPHCESQFDLLARDMEGKYQRVTQFLSEVDPPKAPATLRKGLPEIIFIWEQILDNYRYTKDIVGVSGPKDAWQASRDTVRYGNGDCEDTSILLADWLVASGYEARVAIGTTEQEEGHAWCVVRHDGEEYILESTAAEPDISNPPLVSSIGREYHPTYLFDRQKIYFRRHEGWTPDYWTDRTWQSVEHPHQPETVANR